MAVFGEAIIRKPTWRLLPVVVLTVIIALFGRSADVKRSKHVNSGYRNADH